MSFSNNLKYLRKNRKPKVTQSEMSELLGVSVSTYGAYEEGRAEPKLDNLRKLASFFRVSMEQLLHDDLSRVANETAFSQSDQVKMGSEILVATVDSSGRDNIEWVSTKAAAGYTAGYADLEFVQELPVFQVPFLDSRKKYRVFTIQGDSMLPVPSGSMIFAEYVDDWTQIKDDSLCIVVTHSEGIVFKKVINYLKKQNCLLLISTNPIYRPFLVAASDVVEVWKFAGFFSSVFPEIQSGFSD
ncbi:MAG TPA: LexA family transcriptional regulator [Catalimonadaceae bacterium]|jgi:transcriptional regulator with XRE-family HTH domain|nr:LexA family transcriptional regulator [Catalimonadaceae bacterium]